MAVNPRVKLRIVTSARRRRSWMTRPGHHATTLITTPTTPDCRQSSAANTQTILLRRSMALQLPAAPPPAQSASSSRPHNTHRVVVATSRRAALLSLASSAAGAGQQQQAVRGRLATAAGAPSPAAAAAAAAAGAAPMPPRLLDAHVHVWAPVQEARAGKFPYHGGQMLGAAGSTADEPPMPGHAELLLQAMAEAGVSGALIVQPANHMFDHRYVRSVLAAHPDKFVGCLLADPTPGGGGAAAVIELATQEPRFRAVRFNPYLWPEGQAMTNEVGQEMYAAAGRLGLPVAHMPFKGLLRHADEIEALLTQHPETRAIIDHCGFCQASDLTSPEWRRLLGWADKFPQLYVKASALFRISAQPPPHADALAGVAALVGAYGPQRVMWGSDWPWVTEKGGYAKAWSALADHEAETGTQLLTDEQRSWVLGGTLASLFPGAWQQQE